MDITELITFAEVMMFTTITLAISKQTDAGRHDEYYLLGCDTVVWKKFTDVSEKYTASIFRVKDMISKQQASGQLQVKF
jgi:hypothetical protein